jgi:AmmeMemoRadiSam system protein A
MGAGHASVIAYANSGDTAIGDRSRVVGYGAVSFARGATDPDVAALERAPEVPTDGSLGEADGKALLAFARKNIERWLVTETFPLARGFSPRACSKQGAFVTLKKHGELRGCIGHREADQPLCQVVGSMALQAAFNDRRFKPVEADELDEIEIEISLLTPFRRIASAGEIELGRDGVYLVKNGRSAIYLPEVAVEQGWNVEETMAHLCRKAGLPPDAWKSGAELYTFRSVLIREGGGA